MIGGIKSRRGEFQPKLFTLIREGIDREQVVRDIISGTIVGIVALPLAIAFAIASGVSPEKGLITAIVAGFLISFLGGSRVQIGGPTGAFVVIVYGIVQEYGIAGLTAATLIAGVLILLMGLVGMGALLKYIPHSLIVGFTAGIAVIIFSSQVKDFLGLQTGDLPADFVGKWRTILSSLSTVNIYAVGIGLGVIIFIRQFSRITTLIPGSFLAIIITTFLVQIFDWPVETIESKYGAIPNEVRLPAFQALSLDDIQHLMKPALAIALLGAIESLLSAVVADGMIGGRHRSNMELVAQGLANVASSIFGGIPATGAIARTATNVKNGGRTPLAGMVHAIVLLFIMLVAAPYAKLIPLSCLAGILIVVAYNMGEWHSFRSVLRGNRYDALVLLLTFILTIVFDLILAIEVGIVLSAFIFMKRMADITEFKLSSLEEMEGEDQAGLSQYHPLQEKGVLVYEVSGPLFFGAAQQFQEASRQIGIKPKAVILRMDQVPFIDATGLYRLNELIKNYQKNGVAVLLTEMNDEVKKEILKNELALPAQLIDNFEQAKEQLLHSPQMS